MFIIFIIFKEIVNGCIFLIEIFELLTGRSIRLNISLKYLKYWELVNGSSIVKIHISVYSAVNENLFSA